MYVYEDIIREVGLSPNETRIYEVLVGSGPASVELISAKSKVHRRNIYDCLSKLLNRGLVSESFAEGRKVYRAINPSRLLDILLEKEEKLKTALPHLQRKFAETGVTEEAYMYRGIEGFKNHWNDILKTGETVYFIGAKGLWLDPRLQYALPKFNEERKRRGIKFMLLFDHEIKKQKPEILKITGKPYRFLPKEYSSPTAIEIFGDYVITFIGTRPGQLPTEPVQFVMKSKSLADGYRKFFWFMWDRCKP
jgi:sugar-specific transcriptional regulator TrmB